MSPHALIREAIRTIPDYPKKGIQFRDVTTLLGNADAFRASIELLVEPFRADKPAAIAGLDARGFIFGGAMAAVLGVGFVPVRKKGKLPGLSIRASYALEYGTDELELHVDAVKPGEKVLVVDDLIATGGTAGAAIDLLERVQAKVVGASFVIDLPELGGAKKLEARGVHVRSLISFAGH
ncbi:MAG: adenine phosphoribosyltransferase [Myxococcaceae bacterium]